MRDRRAVRRFVSYCNRDFVILLHRLDTLGHCAPLVSIIELLCIVLCIDLFAVESVATSVASARSRRQGGIAVLNYTVLVIAVVVASALGRGQLHGRKLLLYKSSTD